MGNGGSVTRARHIARRIHIINEHVRDGEFVFQHVPDANNPLTTWANGFRRRNSAPP